MIAAVTGTCIFGDAATLKDCRVLFGDIFIVPFLGSGIGIGIDSNVQPGVGKFGCN